MKVEVIVEVLKTEIKNMGKAFDNYADRNDQEHEKISVKIDEFIAAADKRYASKWSERVLIYTMSAVGVIIIGAILDTILR